MYVIFNRMLVIDGWGISCKIAVRWMPLGLTDDKSALVEVMAWCYQVRSHYLNQYWPSSMSPWHHYWLGYNRLMAKWMKRGNFLICRLLWGSLPHTHIYGTSTCRLNSSSWLLKPLYSGLIVLKRRPILSYWPTCGLWSPDSFIMRIYWCQQWSGMPGPWFNVKMTSYQYRKSHCGDKMVIR